MKISRQRFHALPKRAGNFIELQPEKIFDLSTGDQHRNSVGESDHHRPRDVFHTCAQARHAHDDEQYSGHHSAHEQAVDAVYRDDSCHDHNKRSGRPANLCAGAAERRNQKPRNDGAINSCLWSQP